MNSKSCLIIIGAVVMVALLVAFDAWVIQQLYDWTTDHILTGLQESGMIAGTITLWQAFVLEIFMSSVTGVAGLFGAISAKK